MLTPRIAASPMVKSQQSRPLIVLQITDTHLNADPEARLRGIDTGRTLDAVLAHAQGDRRWPPDAILATGDIVHDDGRAAYERFASMLGGFGRPVLCVPGNHDDPEVMMEVLGDAPFTVGGSVKLGGWSFVLLDTTIAGEEGGRLGERRLLALDAALRDEADRHVIICMHHHPIPTGSTWLDGSRIDDGAAFFEVLDAHPNVRCVVWGHVHQASDRRRGRVRLLSAPSTCMQFQPNTAAFALDDLPPGMRWLRLDPDGAVDTAVDWVGR